MLREHYHSRKHLPYRMRKHLICAQKQPRPAHGAVHVIQVDRHLVARDVELLRQLQSIWQVSHGMNL
jgi:hypothetical protein